MNVLITGSSGVLGLNLTNYLKNKNFEKLVLLDINTATEDEGNRISFHKIDIRDKAALEKVITGMDVVVHSASATPAYGDEEIFEINVEGTGNLLEICHKKNVGRFIYISSTSVYGIPGKSPVSEDDPVQPFDAYNKSKIEAEKLCSLYREKGMVIPVLRPRTFIGPWRLGTFSLLFEWASEKKHFPILGKGMNRYQFLDVEDLCHAVYLCMTKPEEDVNDTFNIGAKEFGTFRDDYQAVLDSAGYGKRIVRLPSAPAMLILRFFAFLKLIPLYKRLYEKVNRDYYVSVKKAEEKLGFIPSYSNKDSLVRAYNWYLQNCGKFHKFTGVSNACPWKQGVLKLCKIFF